MMKSIKRFDLIVIGVVAVNVLLTLGVMLLGSWTGLPTPELSGVTNGQTGAFGPVGFQFSVAVQKDTVEAGLRSDPEVKGWWSWEGNTAWFHPSDALSKETPTRFWFESSTVVASDGRYMRKSAEWEVLARPARLVYLAYENDGTELYELDSDGATTKLTDSGGGAYDFAVTTDGGEVYYSLANKERGIDLWRMRLSDRQPELVLDCGPDWCINPALSPDGKTLAYSRRRAGVDVGGAPGAPRVWMLDMATKATSSLHPDNNVLGHEPSWSPDGSRLAFFDGNAGGIRVVNIKTWSEQTLPSNYGIVGAWSPDGQQMIYADMDDLATVPAVSLFRVDFNTGNIQRWPKGDLQNTDYAVPDWSSSGVLVGLKSAASLSPARQIWLFSTDGETAEKKLDDPLMTYSNYQWDPWGEQVVIQQFRLESSSSRPELAIFDTDTWEPTTVIKNGAFLAQWAP